ncbi:hypothetical protein [Nitrobacter sp.]|uniref:hypothetical protein n=1 Tax=Nitrobacter sp. TaxID=29420 RepID=UPI001DE500F4|nr:hypothetical protein [Nitrobacter sp.]MCB1394156.1 hypothetical protein [Nitrobacter sp.]MCV0387335.1 hypothetical protein [Nitrobacter sp.]
MARKHKDIVVNGVKLEGVDAPGFRLVARKDRKPDVYWYAPKSAVKAGYRPSIVRLAGNTDSEPELRAMFKRCRDLWAEVVIWKKKGDTGNRLRYDYTFRSLINLYQKDPRSPFHETRHNTQRGYLSWLRALDSLAGDKVIGDLTGTDIRELHRRARKPSKDGQPNRERLAKAIVQIIRILLAYGRENGFSDCANLSSMIDGIEFRRENDEKRLGKPKPKPKVVMTYGQAEAIVRKGLEMGTHRGRSVALAVAAQFEFTISQIDAIGYWMPAKTVAIDPGMIVSAGKIWRPGLRFEDLETGILDMARLKTGRAAQFDVSEYPLFQLALSAVPEDKRSGPLVTDDDGLPVRYRVFYGMYQKVREAAGVPEVVWNARARHGGGTEARASGASIEDTTDHMQKSDMEGTRRDYIGGNVETTRRVARKRVKSRQDAHRDSVSGSAMRDDSGSDYDKAKEALRLLIGRTIADLDALDALI